MPEKFTLETDEGTRECRIITSLYSENRDRHYLIYEYTDMPSEDIFVSIYDPDSDEDDYELLDVTDDTELDEVARLLEEYME